MNLVPQTNGGALMPPFLPGEPRDPAIVQKAVGMRAIRKEVRRLFADASVPNAKRLLELCLSDDERVAVVALKEYYDRFHGRVSDSGFGHDEAGGAIDLSHLSEDQRREAFAALETLARVAGVGGGE